MIYTENKSNQNNINPKVFVPILLAREVTFFIRNEAQFPRLMAGKH